MTDSNPTHPIYETNRNFLQERFPALLQLLDSTPQDHCFRETARNGNPTLRYVRDQNSFYLHSRFNPLEESAKLVQSKNLHADHIVVLGLGLGYHLERILENKDPLARVFLIEPDLEIVKNSLHSFPWYRWLRVKEFFYVFGSSPGLISDTIHRFINITLFEQVEVIELPAETRVLESYFQSARQMVDAEIKSNLYDFKTRLAESYLMPRNILNNFPLILKSRPITGLKNYFKGVPGFIVGAGPSLDRNVLNLKKVRDRAVIVAVDTALKPLMARGLHPHFTAIGDPTYKNYLHLLGTEKKVRHYLVAESGISQRIYRDFHPSMFSLSIGKPITRLLEAHSEPLGEIDAWGSVISIALDFAVYIGLEPIVFLGQDFAFSDSRNHCRGTSWEEEKREFSRDLDDLQRFENNSIGGDRKMTKTQDIHGMPTFTSERLVLYKNFLARLVSRYRGTRFFNGTQGGIFSEIPAIELPTALRAFVFGRETLNFAKLQELPTLAKPDNIQRVLAFIQEKSLFFKGYLERVEILYPLLEKHGEVEPAGLLPLVQQSEQLQNELYGGSENGEILEMWSAAPMFQYLKENKRLRGCPPDTSTLQKNLSLFQRYFFQIKPLLKDIVQQLEKTRQRILQEHPVGSAPDGEHTA